MSQAEVMRLAIGASDDLSRVLGLQELLRIALEEFDHPSEKTSQRVDLLLSIYLCQSEPWLEDLELGLQRIRSSLANKPPAQADTTA